MPAAGTSFAELSWTHSLERDVLDLIRKIFAQRLTIDTDNGRDVGLRDAEGGHLAHKATLRGTRFKLAGHLVPFYRREMRLDPLVF